MIVYLCGPITGCSDEEASGWRKDAENKLNSLKIYTLNPMDRDYRGNPCSHLPELVVEDKIDIEMSDVLLVNYYRPSIGTSQEIILGWERNKRVITVAAPGIERPAWLVYHTHNFFDNFEDAYEKIFELNKRVKKLR
jgi:hypothetical protein